MTEQNVQGLDDEETQLTVRLIFTDGRELHLTPKEIKLANVLHQTMLLELENSNGSDEGYVDIPVNVEVQYKFRVFELFVKYLKIFSENESTPMEERKLMYTFACFEKNFERTHTERLTEIRFLTNLWKDNCRHDFYDLSAMCSYYDFREGVKMMNAVLASCIMEEPQYPWFSVAPESKYNWKYSFDLMQEDLTLDMRKFRKKRHDLWPEVFDYDSEEENQIQTFIKEKSTSVY